MSSNRLAARDVVSLRRAAGRVVGRWDAEELEGRRLFCALHDGDAVDAQAPTDASIQAALAAYSKKSAVKSAVAATSYTPVRKVTINAKAAASVSVPVKGTKALVVNPVTFSTNAAGLPLLSSRSDGAGLKIFLDFDGDGSNSAYDTNGVAGTFDTTEQTVIYNAWRDVVSYFSMYNVNVTTVQPATGGTNPVFVWQVISNDTGGSAYVGIINNYRAEGWNASSSARTRTSAIAHEIGHQLNNYHQSVYDTAGNKTSEYTSGYDGHGAIMGSDFGQDVVKWNYGRSANGNDVFQDDMARSSAYIASRNGSIYGDGYRPDDFTGTTLSSATALTASNGSYQTSGIIERQTDADYFSFASTGQTFNVNVEPTFESGLAPKLELYDAATGKLIAAKDDTSLRAWDDNTDEEFTLTLPAGNYVARVSGHGDYADQGEYAFYASPLPAGWASADVTTTGTGAAGTGRGGYVTYDSASGVWFQGGSGDDIGGTADSFHYSYQTLVGNGTVVARVLGFDGVAGDANAGIMLRETLADTSRFAMIDFTPAGSQTVTRTTAGASATTLAGTTAMPGYLRITRTGTTVLLQRSADGSTWNAGNTYTFSGLANQVYVGLAVTSADEGQQATASFDSVALTGTLGATAPAFNALAAPANLTAAPVAAQGTGMVLNWTDGVGETGYAIERSVDGVNWATIATTAANVTTYTDNQTFGSMRWWYRLAAADATGKSVYSTVVDVVNKPAAPATGLGVTVSNTEVSLSWRDVSGDTGYRIEKSANGGGTWTTLGTTLTNITGYNVTSGLTAGTAYSFRITPLSGVGDGVPRVIGATTALPAVGTLAVTSKAATNVALAWTDIAGETGYRVERSTDRGTWASIGTTTANVTAFTDTTAAPLTHYYYRVYGTLGGVSSIDGNVAFAATPAATANAAPWASSDIGTPGGSGAAYTNGTTATVIASGESLVSSTADELHFLYKPLTGNGEVIARVASLEDLGQYTRAGVMFRESLAANSKYASVVYQPASGGQGTDFLYRSGTSGGTSVAGPTDSTYQYVRLVRSGNTVTAYASATNGNWTQIGSAVTISMASTIYVGVAVSSRDDDYLATATFDNINVISATPPALTSTVVNDGSMQRSMVRSLTLNFNQPVTLGVAALTLQQQITGGTYVASTAAYTLTPATTGGPSLTYTLTFTDAGGSIADGTYRLLVNAAFVTNAGGTAMAAATSFDFKRLFGDSDGDGGVSINDFNVFATAFGSTLGNAAYNASFDFDGDNGISINDFNALASRFGVTI